MIPTATREKSIQELLDYYEDELAKGRRLSPSQVCKHHPELFVDVARRIQMLEALEAFLESGRGSPYDTFRSEDRRLLLGYEVEKRIGDGANGIVYRARQTVLNRLVAVKVINSDKPHQIKREAGILAAIRSPFVVTIHDFRELSQELFVIVMELIEGGSLLDAMDQSGGVIREPQAVAWMGNVASAMVAVDEKGITHRDLKPSNILIDRDGHAKVSDFGIAIGTSSAFATSHWGPAGTPAYMAPEQFVTGKVDRRADVYGFGATFYHAIVGEPPFTANEFSAYGYKHANERLVPPDKRNPALSKRTSDLLAKCLAKSPEDRFQTFQDVIHWLDGRDPGPKPAPIGVPLWVYKCNARSGAEGDWDYFFDEMDGEGEWGGTWCTKNRASRKIIRERLEVGDLVLAWQSDKQAALGLCRIAELVDDGQDIGIVLQTVMRFEQPVKLLERRDRPPALASGKAFRQGNAGTIFETTPAEAAEILRICGVDPTILPPARASRPNSKARSWWVFHIDGKKWLSDPLAKGDIDSWPCNDKAKRGDWGLIYATKPVSALVGVLATTSPASSYEDAGQPFLCDVKCRVVFRTPLTLNEMKKDPELGQEPLVQQGFQAMFGPPRIEDAILNRLAEIIPELSRLLTRAK